MATRSGALCTHTLSKTHTRTLPQSDDPAADYSAANASANHTADCPAACRDHSTTHNRCVVLCTCTLSKTHTHTHAHYTLTGGCQDLRLDAVDSSFERSLPVAFEWYACAVYVLTI